MLVPQTHEQIGDKLSKKNIDWAWYTGAWQATLDQFKDSGTLSKIPNFQYHHQPFNYFVQQGPQNPLERSKRLRDDGLGGWWEHVTPPKGDRWGPGTRIPALMVSPFARKWRPHGV